MVNLDQGRQHWHRSYNPTHLELSWVKRLAGVNELSGALICAVDPLQWVHLARIDSTIAIEESKFHAGETGAPKRKSPRSQTFRMAFLREFEQPLQ